MAVPYVTREVAKQIAKEVMDSKTSSEIHLYRHSVLVTKMEGDTEGPFGVVDIINTSEEPITSMLEINNIDAAFTGVIKLESGVKTAIAITPADNIEIDPPLFLYVDDTMIDEGVQTFIPPDSGVDVADVVTQII